VPFSARWGKPSCRRHGIAVYPKYQTRKVDPPKEFFGFFIYVMIEKKQGREHITSLLSVLQNAAQQNAMSHAPFGA
jgi:hypothetical protein